MSTSEIVLRIRQAHELLISIARDLRRADDFDHAQDMSHAALYCRAAANELEDGRPAPKRRRTKAQKEGLPEPKP